MGKGGEGRDSDSDKIDKDTVLTVVTNGTGTDASVLVERTPEWTISGFNRTGDLVS